MEDSRGLWDGTAQDLRRLEGALDECGRSGEGLEKRLSKLEGVCGRLDGVSHSVDKIKEGSRLISISNSEN